jgi:hypothetical protein
MCLAKPNLECETCKSSFKAWCREHGECNSAETSITEGKTWSTQNCQYVGLFCNPLTSLCCFYN